MTAVGDARKAKAERERDCRTGHAWMEQRRVDSLTPFAFVCEACDLVLRIGDELTQSERGELEFLRERKATYMAGLGERFASELGALREVKRLRDAIHALADDLTPIDERRNWPEHISNRVRAIARDEASDDA